MLTVSATKPVLIELIDVPERLRQINEAQVENIRGSLQEIGLQTKISLRIIAGADGERFSLVAGRHRLVAAKLLGWQEITADIVDGDVIDFALWEIAENLHRAELTILERSEHVAKWLRMTDARRISRQVAAKPGRPEGGVRAAAREIGVSEREIRRSVTIDSLTPQAKQAARNAGLDRNQSALLEIAEAAAAQRTDAVQRAVAGSGKSRPRDSGAAPRSANDEMVTSDELLAVIELLCSRLGDDFARFQRLVRDVDAHRFKRAVLAAAAAMTSS